MRSRTLSNAVIALLFVMMAGCGGSTDGTLAKSGSTPGAGATSSVQMSLVLGVATLSAGGSTSITANLTDSTGAPYTTSTDVTFSSTCVAAQTATLSTPVTTTTGSAVSTYVAKGCEGTDTITATASAGGTITATTSITVLPASLGSIQFVSATPTNIALKGTGGAGLSETSTVIFKVLNTAGGVAANKDVTFALDTSVGGLTLTPSTAKTDANGQAQTVIQAGTIPTPVRVTATVTSTSITTQSDQLAITTSIPTQKNISLSAATLNPEAWSIDGVTVVITARLADRFNNPVPDGTSVTFTTEGGAIGGSCTTTAGACSVNWISQDSRPSNGRTTIMATAIGEESFTDNNGNGTFDNSDTFPGANDLAEAYRDDNENAAYDSGEFFVDYNVNGTYDVADGKFNGILCTHSTLCGTAQKITVRDDIVLVMSGSTATVNLSATALDVRTAAPGTGPTTLNITIGDLHSQPMPKGTTVSISTDNGKLSGPTSYTVGNTNVNAPLSYSILVSTDGTSSTGTLTVTVTTPSGVATYRTVAVQD